MDDKNKNQNIGKEEKPISAANERVRENEDKIFDMKRELEDYLEEQGIYIRR